MMRMNVCVCLSAFILSCRVCAGMVPVAVKEKSSVSLLCSKTVNNSMIWKKRTHGQNSHLILSLIGDEIRRENDPKKRFHSVGYNSLYINRVKPSDSGEYFCNDEWSAELTVIPTGTIIQHVREGTSVTLTCPHVTGSNDPIWKRESDGWRPRSGRTLLNLTLSLSGLYSCDGKPAVYLNVTKGDDEAPSTATDAKMTSTSATTTTATTETTAAETTTATTEKKTASKKNKNKDREPGNEGGKKTKTPKTPTLEPTATASTTVTKGAEAHPLGLIIGIPVLCLFLILLFILCLISRRRLKRRAVTESHPVYEEIQDQVEFRAVRGVGSSEMTAAFKKTPIPDVEILDSAYSMITFPPNSGSQIPAAESPYSLIGDPVLCGNNGSSQPTNIYDRILE